MWFIETFIHNSHIETFIYIQFDRQNKVFITIETKS
jgi:DNA-directed RNA polymerase subunit E'/Rpb7